VLFTNHALAGTVPSNKLIIAGSMIARDDGLLYGNWLILQRDNRLLDNNNVVYLPMAIGRPILRRWEGEQESPLP